MSRLPAFFAAVLLATTVDARGANLTDDWENADSKERPPPMSDEGKQARPPDDGFDSGSESNRNLPEFEGENLAEGSTIIDQRQPKWGVELRFTPYKPTLSNNGQVQRLYDMVYESNGGGLIPGHPITIGVDVDWYPLETVGIKSPLPGFFGVYARMSYWTVSGPTRLCWDYTIGKSKPCDSTTVFTESIKGNDTGSINVTPLGLGIVYRFDNIRRHTRVPLMFNFKAGFDYYLWWATSGAGASHYVDPVTGDKSLARGGTLGFSASAGLSLGFDALGRTSAGRDSTRSAIFAEYMLQDGHAIAGSNTSERLDFTSDNHIMITVGLELEFM